MCAPKVFAVFFLLFFSIISIHCFAIVEVTDLAGRKVTLNKPAKRAVALAPHIVENIFSAGAGQAIVGAVDYCDFPEEAKKIPRVGAISTFSVEAIVALNPDIVIVWNSGKGANILPKLEALGIPVYASEPHALDDIPKLIRHYGALFNTTTIADNEALSFERKLNRLRTKYKNALVVPAFYQVWPDPLQTLNGQHIVSDVLAMCGGKNVFADLPMIAPKISIESVLTRNPMAIIASGLDHRPPDWLYDWNKWPSIDAVRYQHLYHVPPDFIQRHTVRMLQGAELVCEQLDYARETLEAKK